MRYRILFLFLFMGLGGMVFGQIDEEDGDMSWRQKLAKADELMEMGSYYNAITYYKAVLDERPQEGDVALKLANALYSGRNYQEAEEYYKLAYEADKDKYAEAQYYYAQMLKMNGKYEQAQEVFDAFYAEYRGKNRDLKMAARYEAEGAAEAMLLIHDSLPVVMTHLSENVNDIYTEFSPVFHNGRLIYGSLKVDDVPVLEKKSEKVPRAKLYVSTLSNEEFSEGEELEGPFNSDKEHTGNGSYSQDGKRFYFTRCTDDRGANVTCDIYLSEFVDGEWSNPKKLDINDKDANDTHPIVVPYRNSDLLIFSSNREGGRGGMDLWYAMNLRGEWRAPRNMRSQNTEGDEVTPFYDAGNLLLYYSSNTSNRRQKTFGGFDVFVVQRRSETSTNFSRPQNVGWPINSPVDDMYYFQNEDGETGYIVSNRTGSISPKWEHCCDDIWAFQYINPPRFTIMARVVDAESKVPLDSANIQLLIADVKGVVDSAVSERETYSEFFLGTEFNNYVLEALRPGYYRGTNTTSTVGLEESDTLYVDIPLRPITGDVITLRNVYFDLDQCFIREDAMPSLDTVYNLLIENPHVQIELSSHTDSRASDAHNMQLSQCRADSSKAYLVQLGIDPERIVATGYGEEKLLNDCDDGVPCTEIEHQLNRRTEFRVIGEVEGTIVNYDKSEIERIKEKKKQGTLRGDERVFEFDEGGDEEIEETP